MFFVVPVIVTERPNVTAPALALIVRLPLGFPGLGGFAATAGPAQTRTTASAAPIFFMSLERRGCPQVGYMEEKGAPGGAPFTNRSCRGSAGGARCGSRAARA